VCSMWAYHLCVHVIYDHSLYVCRN
jgi:hypothetical protein